VREAFVFVVGGGNYTEHQNLIDFAAAPAGSAARRPAATTATTSARTVVYGATELLTAEQLLEQLRALHDKK